MSDSKFEAWGLIELFGHNRIAGQISEAVIGGCSFIRVDVPEVGDVPAYTKFYTQGAIYAMTITSKDIAVNIAENLRARPVTPYEIRTPQLPFGFIVTEPDEDPASY